MEYIGRGIFIAAILAFLYFARYGVPAMPDRPRPMSLKSQDNRSSIEKAFDGWARTMRWLFVLLVILMPIVMTAFFRIFDTTQH